MVTSEGFQDLGGTPSAPVTISHYSKDTERLRSGLAWEEAQVGGGRVPGLPGLDLLLSSGRLWTEQTCTTYSY